MRPIRRLVALASVLVLMASPNPSLAQPADTISLPQPDRVGSTSLERALAKRRSIRTFTDRAVSLSDLSQLLWAAQGVTHREGYRTAPSAGALYPLDVYLTGGKIDGLATGTYRYRPDDHALVQTSETDLRRDLARAALGQTWVRRAPLAFVITATYERTTRKYGRRGLRYARIEVGHAAQNVYLQATALQLGTVMVGAFDDQKVGALLNLPEGTNALAILPVGHRPR